MQLTQVEGNPLPCFWLNERTLRALVMALSQHWYITPGAVDERIAYRVTAALPDEIIALNPAARTLLDELATALEIMPLGLDADHITAGSESKPAPHLKFLLKNRVIWSK